MILTLLVVAHLQQPQLNGIQLKPSYTITEPSDIQPAAGVNLNHRTFTPQTADPYRGGEISVKQCGLSPCLELNFRPEHLDVQAAYASGGLK